MSEQRASFFVRKVGHAPRFARTEIISLTIFDGALTVVRNGPKRRNEN
jgi:hypothetical protein